MMQEKRLKCSISENFDALRSLTNSLPTFDEIIRSQSPAFTEIKMEKGVGFGWCLMDIPEINVSRWFSSNGSIFPQHSHEEREWLVCYQGKMQVIFSDSVKTLRAGSYVHVKPGAIHSMEFVEDTWYIAVIIPSDLSFPHD